MVRKGPNILVAADDSAERALIAATLAEAGFAVVVAADEASVAAAVRREAFAAAVLAPGGDGGDLPDTVQRIAPNLPPLIIRDAGTPVFDDSEAAMVISRPVDPRRLLGCVVEAVLRDSGDAIRHGESAEHCIAAAQLACLRNRRVTAAATGAALLAHELTHQISRVRTAYRGLLAAAD